MKLLFTLFILLGGSNLFAQMEKDSPRIPLQKEIEVEIISIDSTSLGMYQVYEFIYLDKKKETRARFWIEKGSNDFKLGNTKVKLCRVIQIKSENGINSRGCVTYNGLYISVTDSTSKRFDFDEYGESPTFRLCSSD